MYDRKPDVQERTRLEQAIRAQEALRGTLPDTVIDATVAALHEKLASLEPASKDERRKLVTVLFADLVGWTAMSERMDPEDVREVQQAYIAAVTPPIHKFGGSVEKYIGDAVLAVFGVPQAREDDPERALRAALEMHTALESLRGQNRLPLPSMRIGVHTGLVVATVGEREQDFVITGDAVNLASRLESAAPPGGVLTSHDTFRHVRNLFDVQVLAPITVKGKVEPVIVYLVEKARSLHFRPVTRGVEGIQTRLIGREQELQLFQEAWLGVIKTGKCQMVTLMGEAGVGKSRLLYEFRGWADDLPQVIRVFKGRATQETQKLPYALLRNLIADYCLVREDDQAQDVRLKLETGISKMLESGEASQMRAHFIGQLLGYDFSASHHLAGALGDPQQIHDRGRLYLRDFFRAAAGQNPSMILLEDIHWADSSSLEILHYLARMLSDSSLLIVCLARPSLLEHQPFWDGNERFHTRLNLDALTKQDSLRLVGEILQKVRDLPDQLRDLVVNSSDGNPFFVEELIKMLIEDGVILTGAEQWQVRPERLEQVRVPPTLAGVLQARLERLPYPQRTVLQQASVVGRSFWDNAIKRILQSIDDVIGVDDLIPSLLALQEREMVFRRGNSTIVDAGEYIFKHALLREVTYESLLKRLRRIYHGLVADWLMEQSGDRAGEVSGLIAGHLEMAGRNREAAMYLGKAARQAAASYANVQALDYYRRAIALYEALPEGANRNKAIAEHYEGMGDIHGLLQQKAEAQEAYQQALSHLEESERIRQAGLHRKIGDYFDQFSDRRQAYDLAETALGDEPLEPVQAWWQEWLDIQLNRMMMFYLYDKTDHIGTMPDRVKQLLEEYGTPLQRAKFLGFLGAWDNRRTRYVISQKAISYNREALSIVRGIGNSREIATRQFGLAFNLLWHGDLRAAENELRAAFKLGEQIGDAWTQTVSLTYLSICHRLMGQIEMVRSEAPRVLEMARMAELESYVGVGQANQAWLDWRDGKLNLAEEGDSQAFLALLQANYPFKWIALLPLIAIFVAIGDQDQAIQYIGQLLDHSQMRLPAPIETAAENALSSWHKGDLQAVGAYLERTVQLAREKGYL